MNPIDHFRINKVVTYKGSQETLIAMIDEVRQDPFGKEEIDLRQNGELSYLLTARIAFGTATVSINQKRYATGGITVNAYVRSVSDTKHEIVFRTKVRVEQYAIFIAFALSFLGLFIGMPPLPAWILVGVLWPVAQLWFNYVHRSQQLALIDDFKKSLALKMTSGRF
jgi:hypothetical protein